MKAETKAKVKKGFKIGGIVLGALGTLFGTGYVCYKKGHADGYYDHTKDFINDRLEVVNSCMDYVRKDLEDGRHVAYHFNDGKCIDCTLIDGNPDWMNNVETEQVVYF